MTFHCVVLGILMLLQSSVGIASREQQIVELKVRAESGDVRAQVELGTAYAMGDGVMADDVEAVRWFRRAAEKRDSAGEYSLGEMYLSGRGVTSDLAEAVRWMRRAAEDGDARGQFNLAAMYAQGQGVPQDKGEAVKWMRKAAEQGLAAGQFGLGSLYAHGSGVPQNVSEAANWYRKAADQGDLEAMNNLAFLLATTTDPKVRDLKRAIALAQKAVEREADNPTYLDTLARVYFEDRQTRKAAETERQALKLKPDDASYKKALEKYEVANQH